MPVNLQNLLMPWAKTRASTEDFGVALVFLYYGTALLLLLLLLLLVLYSINS